MRGAWSDRDQTPSLMLALPIFPGRRQPSIFGAGELNFRVRDGNGWTLTAISTNFVDAGSVSFASALGESSLTSLHLLSDKSKDRFCRLSLANQ